MLSFRALLIVASVLCFALRSFGQTVVVISDNPTTGTAAANPATSSIFGGTLIVSQDDTADTTFLTLDANLVAKVAEANGNITQIQEALGYGYHNALSKKFITIPVLAISGLIAYVSILLAEDQHLISTTNGISNVEPMRLGLSTSDTNALAAAGPDPGILVISKVGSGTLQTVTMPGAAVATATGDVCPDDIACDDSGCNAPAPSIFCPEGQKYEMCECKLVYYNSNQVGGNVTALAIGASLFSAMMSMTNAPTATPSITGPVCTSTSSVYGCPNPCCYCPEGGGAVAPFLTTTVAGTPTTNCAYTAQPTEDNCPAAAVSSSLPIPTSPTSSTAVASPTVEPVVCNTYETSYSNCWTDIDSKEVNTTADWMIAHQLPNGSMTSKSPNITQVLTANGLTYLMNIGWIPGCVAESSQDPAHPIASDQTITTRDILWENYNNCPNNHGIGGYSDAVCLRIGFFPNKVKGVSGSPPTPTKYWNNPVYC